MKQFVVIGGSTGIGAQLTENLAENNAVFASFNNTPKQSAGNIHYFQANALEPIDFSFLPEQIHGLAYCVGSISLKPFARISAADFIADYQKQVVGAISIIQQLLPRLKAAENASIVLFSTVAVQTGFPFHTLVSSSKGALEGLTRALAAELAPKIRVNCIAPSITQTPLASALLSSPEKIEANALRHPLKRIGAAEDVANLAEFLLSDKSSWITGQIHAIDGGMSALRV